MGGWIGGCGERGLSTGRSSGGIIRAMAGLSGAVSLCGKPSGFGERSSTARPTLLRYHGPRTRFFSDLLPALWLCSSFVPRLFAFSGSPFAFDFLIEELWEPPIPDDGAGGAAFCFYSREWSSGDAIPGEPAIRDYEIHPAAAAAAAAAAAEGSGR
jgi:hypothetical protein